MRILVSMLLVTALAGLAGQAGAREMARPTHGGIPSPEAVVRATPTAPNAPNQGVITRLELAKKTISISGQEMTISQGLVAILDRRANAAGSNRIGDLRVGMPVRYRSQAGAGGLPRVVELWVLADAPVAPSKRK